MIRAEEKAQRLLQIEKLLWAHPEGLTRAEIARRLGVNRSTITKYLDTDQLPKGIYEAEDGSKRLVLDRFPKADGRVRLLKSYSENYSDADPDIQDPYRMSIYHYRVCFSEIYLSVQGLLESLSKRGQR